MVGELTIRLPVHPMYEYMQIVYIYGFFAWLKIIMGWFEEGIIAWECVDGECWKTLAEVDGWSSLPQECVLTQSEIVSCRRNTDV